MAEELTEVVLKEPEQGLNIRLILAALTAVALGLFVIQNTHETEVHFIWLDGSFPLYLLLLITGGLSLVLTVVTTWLLRRRN